METTTHLIAIFGGVVAIMFGTAAWVVRFLVKALIASERARCERAESENDHLRAQHVQDLGIYHSLIGAIVKLSEATERVLQELNRRG